MAATVLFVLGSVLLIVEASAMGEPWKIVSFSIYGASLLFLFSMSTMHHGVEGPWEKIFHMLDYLAIYPLIAGTFTPLCLVYFHQEPIGWAFFATVWFIAIIGMTATAVCFERIPRWMSMTMYITLGWLGACMIYWLVPIMGVSGFLLLLLGGIFFTVGGYVFTMETPNPYPGRFGFHEIWHIFVVLGAGTHWLMMWIFVLPYQPDNVVR
jgi:hemolysin III